MIRLISIVIFLLLSLQAQSQVKIGVRAGQNFSWISGELEEGETNSLSLGFHFGVNFTYQFAPDFGLRAELLYTQKGTKNDFVDTLNSSFLLINPVDNTLEPFFAQGNSNLSLDVSTGYLSIPITAHYNLTEKIELVGGMSLDMLIGPAGRGTMDFRDGAGEYFFRQTYQHSYRKDDAGELDDLISLDQTPFVTIDLNGEKENLYAVETAYQNLEDSDLDDGKKYNFLDANAILGFNYFINSGFYIGLRAEWGLFDMTNENVDFSRKEITSDGEYVRRNDVDKSRSLSLSVGFRF